MRRKWPEEKFSVFMNGDDVVCRWPNGEEQTASLARLAYVYVETEKSNSEGAHVWFILRDVDGSELSFPLGAQGERPVINRLEQLPGFKMDGMDSTERARFLCWAAPGREGRA